MLENAVSIFKMKQKFSVASSRPGFCQSQHSRAHTQTHFSRCSSLKLARKIRFSTNKMNYRSCLYLFHIFKTRRPEQIHWLKKTEKYKKAGNKPTLQSHQNNPLWEFLERRVQRGFPPPSSLRELEVFAS